MSTTIDKLQIEIESSSGNAAKGIDDLAKSLAALKKSGTISVAVKNLNNLSDALNRLPNVHSASNALRTLANSIEKLKGMGSISNLTSSLGKLPGALKSLENINLDNAAPQIQRIADAMAPLSAVKAGGLGTLVNGLARLDKVTESLDDDTITAFTKKVELLTQKLGPLADKMTSIKGGFAAINSAARTTTVSVGKLADEVNVTTLNFSNMVTSVQGVMSALQPLIDLLVTAIGDAMEWDGIQYQFGNAFGDQADEYYEKITKITDALYINKQAFMENSAMAASMLAGFGVDKTDAREMGLGYTQLAYDIWAAYNNVYKTLDGADGAMAAVRSAIAGEVEPIRRAGFTIVDSQLAITAANHGLAYSTTEATEAQKSYLRYLTLVDQAQNKGIVGTYAREMETAEGMTRQLTQQMKSLSQAFGSLFMPILVKVLPYVQAFVELLTDAVHWLAALFGIEIQDIGDTWNDYSTGVGDAVTNTDGVTESLKDATQAAKELKNASIGIDELNVISPPSASSGAGGAGGGAGGGGGSGYDVDVGSLWDQSIFDSIQQKTDELKEKIKDLLPVIGGVATAIAGWKLTQFLSDLDSADSKLLSILDKAKVGKIVSALGITLAVGKLVWDFTGAYLEGGDEADLLKAIGTTTMGVALAKWMAGKPGAAFVLLTSGVVTLTKLGIEIGEGTVEWNDTESLVTALVGGLETVIGAVFTWKTLAPMLKKAWPSIAKAGTSVLSKAGPYGWIALAVVGGITLALVDYDFTDIGHKIGEKIGEALKLGWEFIRDGVVDAWNWAVDALEIDDFWDVLAILFVPGEWERRIAPEIEELFTNLSDWFDEKIENLKGNINEFFAGFFDGLFDGLGWDMSWAEKFTEFFDIDYMDVVEAVVNPMSIGKHIMTGINKGIDSNAKLSAIKEKLSSMWTNAKTWWDTQKKPMKAYTPSIGSIFEKVKERWDNARTWWNEKKTKMKEYTPSIGSIKNKISNAWTTAKNWWSKSRSSLSYTPSIGSIVDKVKSAWNTAKSWWNKNVSLSTKLNIKVPKISVKWKEVEAFGKTFKYPTGFDLKFAAAGGIFDAGSLIWAGERGAEIVANAGGGKTGVMNVQQMQDAVYEGVYAAVTAAMRGTSSGGDQSVNVYLDGRQITAVVEKRQRERGASLMGNEVYSY